MILIYQSKRNVIIVREGEIGKQEDQKRKEILVWWGGKRENVGLMLAMGYMLQVSPEWKGAKLILKTIVKDEEEREKHIEYIEKFVTAGRLSAEVKILVDNIHEDIIATTIRRFSQGADLVFLGMRPPDPDESPQRYAAYYEKLIKSTEKFPPSALVLASENINFSDIFR
jgi:hypothetical protein